MNFRCFILSKFLCSSLNMLYFSSTTENFINDFPQFPLQHHLCITQRTDLSFVCSRHRDYSTMPKISLYDWRSFAALAQLANVRPVYFKSEIAFRTGDLPLPCRYTFYISLACELLQVIAPDDVDEAL
mgnify:CR=1 FL=1